MSAPETASTATEVGGERPLSNAQRLVWTAQQLYPDAPIYNMAFTFVVDGELDPERFGRAFHRLVREAESLRTTFTTVDGRPTRTVVDELDREPVRIDLSTEPEPRRAFREWARRRSRLPIDVASQPFDVAVADLGEGRSGWYLCQHHLLTDASSFAILFARLSELYEDLDPSEPLPPAPEDDAGSDPPPRDDGDRSGSRPDRRLDLYGTTRGRDAGTTSDRRSLELDDATMRSLDELVSSSSLRSITPDLGRFKAYLAALTAYLHRVSGEARIEIGVPLLNRPTPRLKRTPGLRTEVFPLSVEIGERETFRTLFEKVGVASQDLLRRARPGTASPDRNRHLNVAMNYLPTSFGDFAGMSSDAEWLGTGHVEPDHTLRMHVTDWNGTGTHTVLFDLNRGSVGQDVQQRALEHFEHVLRSMLADPDAEIGAVALMSAEELAAVARLATGPTTPTPRSVVSALEDVLRDRAGATALVQGAESWTYADLDVASRRIAASVGRGERVAVAVDRSAAAVVAIVGVLRAGAAFVPVDPTWPAERMAYVVADADVGLVITDDAPRAALADLGSALPGVAVRSVTGLLAADPTDRPRRQPDDTDLAYVLYTSGSTGTPKGVAIEHGALANYVTWARSTYDRGARLRFPLFTPLTFDLTMTSVLVPLTAGGSIRVYPRGADRVDTSIRDVMADGAVDIVKLTPSHLSLVQDMDLGGSPVAQLILGGEDLTRATASRATRQLGGGVVIHNEYGPTEATVGCVVEVYDADSAAGGDSVPIGRPIDNTAAWVLDERAGPVPFGIVGELWLGGAGIARGYVGNPELTAARFRELPALGEGTFYRTGDLARMLPDGTIEYLGRSDDQVKIRGARVELGEVEARLASHPGLAAVVAAAHRRQQVDGDAPERHCTRCGLPSTFPGAGFDTEGVCSECRAFEGYRDEASVYFDTLDGLREILARARERSTSEYDCIALLSGGKDSTYALARIVDLGARPLAFTLDNGYISDGAKENIRRVTETLGVDHVFGTTPAMDEIFVDSLQRHANVCHGCFKTIYTLSLDLARAEGIPLIVTGLSRGQFFETRLTQDLFTGGPVTAEQIDETVLEARRAYHRVDDAPRRLLDVGIFDDDSIFEQVRFADFYRYTDVSLDEMLAYLDQRLPWVRPADTGRSTNCLINDVGIYVHRRERGFHNYALPYSWDVRLGHKQREAAMAELDDDIDPAYVQQVLDEIGYPTDVTAVSDGNRLVAYYVPSSDVSPAELRAHAEQVLPATMVPSQFVEIEEVPLTSNGKVDRTALPDPGTARPELDGAFVAPFTAAQRAIAGVWSDVLEVEPVGIRDDFFDLGGDSIMAIRIVARCSSLGYPFALRDLFENPTVEQLASVRPPADDRSTDGPSTGDAGSGTVRGDRSPSAADLSRLAALLGRKESGS